MRPTRGLLLALLACCLPLGSWSRYISVSMNLSMSYADNDDDRHMLSAEMVRGCLKSTELSMLELNRFRLSLLSEQLLNAASTTGSPATGGSSDETLPEPEVEAPQEDGGDGGGPGPGEAEAEAEDGDNLEYDGNNSYNSDYDAMLSFGGGAGGSTGKVQSPEPIQCFVHCLYEQMGLIKDDQFAEEGFFRRLYALYDRDQKISAECVNFESNNKCESAYKMHLCYNRLKSWDADRRLEEVLNFSELNVSANDDGDGDGDGDGDVEDEENEIENS